MYLESGKRERKRLWFEPHYVACPSMSALCKAAASGIEVSTAWRSHRSARAPTPHGTCRMRTAQRWALRPVISTAPAPQTVRLFDRHLPADAALRDVRYRACLALMLGLEGMPAPGGSPARRATTDRVDRRCNRPDRGAARPLRWWSTRARTGRTGTSSALRARSSTGCATRLHRSHRHRRSRATHAALHRWRYALLDPETATGEPFVSWPEAWPPPGTGARHHASRTPGSPGAVWPRRSWRDRLIGREAGDSRSRRPRTAATWGSRAASARSRRAVSAPCPPRSSHHDVGSLPDQRLGRGDPGPHQQHRRHRHTRRRTRRRRTSPARSPGSC